MTTKTVKMNPRCVWCESTRHGPVESDEECSFEHAKIDLALSVEAVEFLREFRAALGAKGAALWKSVAHENGKTGKRLRRKILQLRSDLDEIYGQYLVLSEYRLEHANKCERAALDEAAREDEADAKEI